MFELAKRKPVQQTDAQSTFSSRSTFWSRLRRNFNSNAALLLMAAPALAHVILFRYVTLPWLLLAFKNFRAPDGLWGSAWVGWKNFAFLFGATGKGWQIVRNVVAYNLVFMVVGTISALAMAVLLSSVYRSRLSKYYQSSLFVPQFVSWVIIGYIGYAFLDKDTGMIDGVIRALGGEAINWYRSPQYWPYIILIAYLWRSLGTPTVVYLAGILGINPELFEAAAIDGASKWQQTRFITLPSLTPLVIVLTLIAIGNIFAADFGLFYQMPRQYTNQTLIRVTDVIDTYVYRALQTGAQVELAAAAGLYRSVVGFVLVLTVNTIIRRINPERALF